MPSPTIFTEQPALRKDDAVRLYPHITNARIPLKKWLDTDPPIDDVKRAVLVELERAKLVDPVNPRRTLSRGVLNLLLKRVQILELTIYENRINEYLTL